MQKCTWYSHAEFHGWRLRLPQVIALPRAGAPGVNMGFPPWYRARAATLYENSGHNAKKAGSLLGPMPDGRAPTRPAQFCKRQFEKLKEHGSPENRPIPGRPRKVPKSLAKKIVAAMLVPSAADEDPIYVESVSHVLRLNANLKQQVKRLDVHPRTLQNAVDREMLAQGLSLRTVKLEMHLSAKQRAARKEFCINARKTANLPRLRATVFVDESSFKLQPIHGKLRVVKRKGDDRGPATTPSDRKRQHVNVHYTGAVLHGVGNVGFVLTTGTTWLGQNYMVCPRRSLLYY